MKKLLLLIGLVVLLSPLVHAGEYVYCMRADCFDSADNCPDNISNTSMTYSGFYKFIGKTCPEYYLEISEEKYLIENPDTAKIVKPETKKTTTEETENRNIFCEWKDNYTNSLYVFVINKNEYQNCKSRNNKSKESTKERYCKTWKNSNEGRKICKENPDTTQVVKQEPEKTSTTLQYDPSQVLKERLKDLKELFEEELINEQEYNQKKQGILDQL